MVFPVPMSASDERRRIEIVRRPFERDRVEAVGQVRGRELLFHAGQVPRKSRHTPAADIQDVAVDLLDDVAAAFEESAQ
jgi:hypothetical protein